MSLVLHVDGPRWRAHLRATAEVRPDLIPVIKGNGYGFGNARLARKAGWLGADTVAVGTYQEIADVRQRFDGDLAVLTPWRAFDADAVLTAIGPDPDRVVHTVGRLADLDALAARLPGARIVLERLTSMKRHGFTARGLREATRAATEAGLRIEGASLHLPMGPGNLAEAADLLTDIVAAGLARPSADGRPATVTVSHLRAEELRGLAEQYPEVRLRPRIGTDLWLGDRGALTARARVLDRHPVERGETFGYRRRRVPRTGTLLVVSGGTAHGIGLEAPTGAPDLRSRAVSVARGGLDAIGLARSPFTVAGAARYFAEPPHMQASMLYLPPGVAVPEVGEEIDVRVRFTATWFDRVEVS